LIQFPCAVAIIVLLESLPVAGGIQSPLLLKRAAGDRRLSPVQRAAFLVIQPVQPVIRIQFVVAGEHSVFSPRAVGCSVIAVLNLCQRCRGFLPEAVINSPKAIEAPIDVACRRIIACAD